MIAVDGERAKAETCGVAFLVADDGREGGRILARGLRYLDDLIKDPAGWQISRRMHIPIWQYEVASIPPGMLQAT
jgi:hypothetical protein